MKTTKTFTYALACIHELAKRYGQFVQVAEIAASQNIPAAYCQKVLCALANSGIVLSVKGQGFCLLEPPEFISSLRVVQALSEDSSSDLFGENSSIQTLSDTITAKINSTLANLTVAELLIVAR